MVNLLCEHSELFSETWPISGMMLDGKVFALPTQAHPITDSEFSSLPTPTTRDHKDGTEPHEREGIVQTDTVARAVFNSGQISFLATPQARDSKGRPGRDEDKNLNHDVARHDLITDWGKFEPAIRRWESILGRPAPAPTKPDGKDGAHRLSSEFTEWMMGVSAGWITGVGLSRNDELKACGNGVVPQQAELALRMLLEGVETTAGGGANNAADSDR
jgi:DNA (cytosine-5)-methyltransferase 1